MKTILHVGESKAGSTALQDSLLNSRSRLAERGILYPRNAPGVKFNNHRLLLQPIREFEKLPGAISRNCDGPEDLARQFDDLVREIAAQVDAERPEWLVLSYEHLLFPVPTERQAPFRKTLERFGARDVEVAVYIRRPSARYLSGVQQSFRMQGVTRKPYGLNYAAAFGAYEAMFGAGSVKPQVFDRTVLVEGSIVTDFGAKFLGLGKASADVLVPPKATNETVSAAGLGILQRFVDEMGADGALGFDLRDLRVALVKADAQLALPKPRMRTDIADEIDYATPQLLWLRDRFGLEFPGYDYARVEAGDLSQLRRSFLLRDILEDTVQPEDRRALAEATSGMTRVAALKAWADGIASET